MKSKFLIVIALFLATNGFGQTLQDAQKELDNENYFKAKQILFKLMNDGSSNKAEVAYYLGNTMLKDDDVDSAKLFYKMAYSPDTRTALGYVANGRLSLLAKNEADAKQNFDRATQTSKSKNAEIFYQIGDAYFKPTISNLNEAIRNFEEAFRVEPKNTTNLLALGDAYLEENDGGKAMSKYDGAIELNKNLAMAYLKKGRLSVRAKIWDDAVSAYNSAIAIDPNFALSYKELGEVYYLTKKYDLVAPQFKKYIDLNPGDAEAKTKYCALLYNSKEYDKVIDEATKNLAKDSVTNNQIYYRMIGYSNFELKRYKEGNEAMKKFWTVSAGKKIKPTDYVYSARLAAAAGDTTTAINYFKTVFQTADSNNADMRSEYCKTLYQAKRYTDAVTEYNNKIAQMGGTSLDYYYLGRSQFSATNYVLADSAFAKFVEKQATSPDGYLWRAKSNVRLEDPKSLKGLAVPFYQKYIEIAQAEAQKNKNNLMDGYLYLCGYYATTGKDKAQAKLYIGKALDLDPTNENAKEFEKSLQ